MRFGLRCFFWIAGLFVCITFLGCVSSCIEEREGWNLVWNDEFSGNELDSTKWDYQSGTGAQYGLNGWGNDELQYYTEDNVSLEDGMLVIEARKEEKEGMPYTSGRIRTYKDDGTILFATTYGRVEARIKMPGGSGIWPAFWMLPASDKYGVWASSGEIDIMEVRGRLMNRSYGTYHYGQPWPGNKNAGGMYKYPGGSTAADFHVYALEWEPGVLRWYVDDELFYEASSWWAMGLDDEEPFPYPAPYDEPFYILFNLAIGGSFDEYRVPSDASLPARMYVDYVRVYDKVGGYNHDVQRPVPERDETSFGSYRRSDTGSFIIDPEFSTATQDALSSNTMDKSRGDWYVLALSEFGGKAVAAVEDGACHVSIEEAGGEVHSVQLLQHLGVAKGYTYVISFEAKAAKDRTIAVKLGGDDDNSWAVYSSQYYPQLSTEYKQFKYRFTMENESDASARLEFNMGKDTAGVWVKNVSVTAVEF